MTNSGTTSSNLFTRKGTSRCKGLCSDLQRDPRTTTTSSTTSAISETPVQTLKTESDPHHFFCFLCPRIFCILGALGFFFASYFLFMCFLIFFRCYEVAGLFSLLSCLFFLFYQVLFCISALHIHYFLWWSAASKRGSFWFFTSVCRSWTFQPNSLMASVWALPYCWSRPEPC